MGENNPKNARLTRLQERRAAIQARMDAHIIGGGPVATSLALIERMRAEGATDLEIDTALAKKKLPSVIEVGRKSALHVPGWWLLTRRKKRLDRKIHALGGG